VAPYLSIQKRMGVLALPYFLHKKIWNLPPYPLPPDPFRGPRESGQGARGKGMNPTND